MRTVATPSDCDVLVLEMIDLFAMPQLPRELASHTVSLHLILGRLGLFSQLAVDRIEYFYDAVQTIDEPLNEAELAPLVTKYVHRCEFRDIPGLTLYRCINRDADELAQLQQERRKGRPPTRREEALKQRTQTEEKEFKTGFWMPDLSDKDVLLALKNWNGEWSGLSPMTFVRLTQDGVKQTSSFPPKGMS